MELPRGPPGSALALQAGEKVRAVALYLSILLATGGAFAVAYVIGERWALFAGLGLAAYVLGLRHGVDADHIAAIDNTTRKLLQDGQRPLSVGTWFSLGHSTVVVALIVALTVATEYISTHVASFATIGTVLGAAISGSFLVLIGLLNVVIVIEVYRIFRGLRTGSLDEEQLNEQLSRRGFLNRYFGRLFRVIDRPWQIYPVGVLFGLGFDTASEILLLGISVTLGVSGAVPLWAVLVLPLLFTCGMVLVDTTDGVAMRYAYGWAFLRPIRKIYYNLTLTVISVLVAFLIGGAELLSVVALALHLGGPYWTWAAQLNLEQLGVAVVAVFLGTWLVAMTLYRLRGYERTPPTDRPPGPGAPEEPGWSPAGP
ncbi:MAG TPA: HoxN/HupN/NixA family nickel/cobalt transporter [Thermoplasmata archaeon]|nr:HoxN/HupN/NixA family nickel/cobalt transporter [Thermoplasmata archaeon]